MVVVGHGRAGSIARRGLAYTVLRASGKPPEGVWECWSLVSALAASTRRIQIGTLW